MFECGRCGSSYNANHIGVEHCPRCLLLDKVETPLAFKAFQRLEPSTAAAGSADASRSWTKRTTAAPSPTAVAQRLIEPARTSPAA